MEAPTRLIDFSKSPYIGAYFAFEECEFVMEKMFQYELLMYIFKI